MTRTTLPRPSRFQIFRNQSNSPVLITAVGKFHVQGFFVGKWQDPGFFHLGIQLLKMLVDSSIGSGLVLFQGEKIVASGLVDLRGDLRIGAHGIDGIDGIDGDGGSRQLPCT